jgi:hypothetical protein
MTRADETDAAYELLSSSPKGSQGVPSCLKKIYLLPLDEYEPFVEASYEEAKEDEPPPRMDY